MIRRFPIPAALLSLALLPGLSAAGVPSAEYSVWPRHVTLVGGDANGFSDPAGRLHFEVRRAGGTVPVEFALVVLDFTQVTGIRLCEDQAPNVIVSCWPGYGPLVQAYADGQGNLDLIVKGYADRSAGGSHAASLLIDVDGVWFGQVPVATYDEDGHGLGPADNSLWQADYFSNLYWERSDFDGDGTLGPSDLSAWLTTYFGNGSISGCAATACP